MNTELPALASKSTRGKAAINVSDYGTLGDGNTKDTLSLQRAIDAAGADGGGRVLVPPGTYLTGTLYLKDNVELHLAAGATLLGSPDRGDYNPDGMFEEDPPPTHNNATAAHLVVAYRKQNVSITGLGTINGNASQFMGPLGTEASPMAYRRKPGNCRIHSWRPGKMLCFIGCTRVALHDIALVDAPYWTVITLDCTNVQFRGLTITNPPDTPNGDGIDIVGCRDVTVSDCRIRSGDDCIVLRSSNQLSPPDSLPCENVTVSNCALSTPCQGIRIGVSDGIVRNCTFSNIVISDTNVGVDIVAKYSDLASVGAQIEYVSFSNIVIDAKIPIVMRAGRDSQPPAAIRDISFSDIDIVASAGALLVGTEETLLERIRFQRTTWTLHAGASADQSRKPRPFDVGGGRITAFAPAALYACHLVDCSFHGMHLRWADTTGEIWEDGILFEQARDTSIDNLTATSPPDTSGPVLSFRGSSRIAVRNCTAGQGTHTFLQVEDSPEDAPPVRCVGNDLIEAKEAWVTDVGAAPGGGNLAGQ